MEYVYPDRSVHITAEELGEKVILKPSGKYEPKGVSFSPTIKQALEGVPYFYNVAGADKPKTIHWDERKKWARRKSKWNVYTPTRKRKAIVPSTIDDFARTGERRVLGKVEVKKMGIISVGVKNNRWVYDWKNKRDWWDDKYYK